jgi:hypothetical protein
MNSRQRIVLGIAVVVVAFVALFPPWIYVYHYDPPFRVRGQQEQRAERPAGHHSIWSSAVPTDQTALIQLFSIQPERASLQYFSMRLDKDKLWLEIGGTLAVSALLCLLLKDRK